MFRQVEIREKVYQPAAVGSGETTAVIAVNPGERVVFASAKPLTAAAASSETTICLGDGTNDDGFIAAYDTEASAVGTLIDGGTAAYFANSGGKLYTEADTIDAKYTVVTPGATNPKVHFRVGVIQEWD